MTSKVPAGGSKSKVSLTSKVVSLAKKVSGGGGTSSHSREGRAPAEEGQRGPRESPAEEDRRRRKEALKEKQRRAAAPKERASVEEGGPSPSKASSRGRSSSSEEEVLEEREDSPEVDAMEEDEIDGSSAINYYGQYTRHELVRMFDHFVDQPMRAPN